MYDIVRNPRTISYVPQVRYRNLPLKASSVFVSEKGFLDPIDDLFWILPFSSDMQAKRIRQENSITEDVWNARRAAIRADHRLPAARGALETSWKKRLESMLSAASAAGAVAPAILDGQVQYDETVD
jgi:hypothetical protein